MLITPNEVSEALNDGVLTVDYRSSDMYLGINKSGKAKRTGTLPGAINLADGEKSWETALATGPEEAICCLRCANQGATDCFLQYRA